VVSPEKSFILMYIFTPNVFRVHWMLRMSIAQR
jgi:hypothetical protein